jgi:hypothetical protein
VHGNGATLLAVKRWKKEHAMFRKIILPGLFVTAMVAAAHAGDTVELTDENTTKIREMLTEQGYEVGKVKIEDGLYEAYARKDGNKYEVFLNAEFAVVRTELDD